MYYSFTDLVDLTAIRNIIESFYKITNIPPSITDLDGNILLTVGFTTICAEFHRVHPETRQRCVQSDTELSRNLNSGGNFACYQCLNGLVDVAIPIVIDSTHVANLFIGQFFMDTPPDREFFRRQAITFEFNIENYLNELDKVPVYPKAKIEEAARFLATQAALIGEMALTQKRLTMFNDELEEKARRRTDQLNKEIANHQRALAELETIFNNSSVAIVHLQGNRIVHNINSRFEELFGYTREEAIGQSVNRVHVSDEIAMEFGLTYGPRLARGEIIQIEYQLKRKDGVIIWCRLYGKAVSPLHLDEGVIWIIDDITERKQFEALKNDVDRILRHDLKTPLNGIVGLSQSLLMDDNLTKQQREDISLIMEAGNRMNTQINQSFQLYKMETGTYTCSPVRTNMTEIIKSTLLDLKQKAATKQLTFRVNVRGIPIDRAAPIHARGEARLSQTMFANLLSNSVEAAPDKTDITLDMNDRNGRFEISIHNMGAVPAKIRRTFFDKYVTFGKGGGTGLGTYTARLMAETQGGTITMASTTETGTTVTIRLPL